MSATTDRGGARVHPETTKSYTYVGVLMWAPHAEAEGGTASVHLCHRCAGLTTDPELHDAVPCGPPAVPITQITITPDPA